MKKADIEYMKRWFEEYVKSYRSDDPDIQYNISLKEEHTENVRRNILFIAKDEGLNEEDTMLSEAVGLFHDVGRFKQYTMYRTFRDGRSVNHGEFGAKVLDEHGVLDALAEDEREIIMNSVKYHNAFSVPNLPDPSCLMFIRLVRDADKLDVYRLMVEYYATPPAERPDSVGLDFKDTPGYSHGPIESIREGKIARLSTLKNLNDFKLMQLSWIYDFNFRGSFRLLSKNGSLEKIVATLPRSDEIKDAFSIINMYIEKRLV